MNIFKIFLTFLFILLFSKQSYSMDNRCYEFIEGIKNLEYEQGFSVREKQTYKDFGFDLHYDPIEGVGLDYDKSASKLRRKKISKVTTL